MHGYGRRVSDLCCRQQGKHRPSGLQNTPGVAILVEVVKKKFLADVELVGVLKTQKHEYTGEVHIYGENELPPYIRQL